MDSAHALPPRKSCDRCYKQKARCLPGPKKQNTQKGDEGDRGTCLRCLQSGSDCFYSPQRKPGRPPLTASTLPHTATKTSSASTSSGLSSLARMTDNVFSLGDADMSHSIPAWLVEGDDIDPSLHPSADVMSGGEDWPVSCVDREFRLDKNHPAIDLYQMPSAPFPVSDVFPASAYHTLHRFSAPSEERSDTDHSHRNVSTSTAANESQQPSDLRSAMGILVQELAELNLRICRLTHSTSIWNLEALPSVNSPIINELFSLTNTLVSVFKKAEGMSDSVSGRPWIEKSESRSLKHLVLLEDGIALMVLSCHQQILSAFDKLYSSIHRHLLSAESPLSQQKFRAYSTQPPSLKLESLESSSTAQSIMIVNLLEHLISCLDRAIAPIADFESIGPTCDSEMTDVMHGMLSVQDVAGGMGSSGSSSPLPSLTPGSSIAREEAIADAVGSIARASKTQVPSSYADITTVGAILDTMKRRRIRVDEHKRQLKVFLESSTNL